MSPVLYKHFPYSLVSATRDSRLLQPINDSICLKSASPQFYRQNSIDMQDHYSYTSNVKSSASVRQEKLGESGSSETSEVLRLLLIQGIHIPEKERLVYEGESIIGVLF